MHCPEVNMEKAMSEINQSSWFECSLHDIEIDFDKITIVVSFNEKVNKEICCHDFIGFSYIGHWDESIIETIKVDTKGSLIDESLQVVKDLNGADPLPGGGDKRITDNWYQLNIKLIDGLIIRLACKSFEVTVSENGQGLEKS